MKNKEIEELLNMLKKCAREDKATLKLNEIACKTILSYIEQLENLCNKYEQEHKTTFEIWKKDIKKLEQLEKENKILRENAEHNDKVVDKVNWEINILKNNRDKAIEYIDNYLEREYFNYDILETNTIYNRDLFKVKNILKGDSDD